MILDHARIIEARPPRAGAVVDCGNIRQIAGATPVLARRLRLNEVAPDQGEAAE